MIQRHLERHRAARVSWLRAAVLGANDGIVSTASLLVGVAAADASHAALLTAGVAAVVAGAMSMAAGEYVSVHSQADTENADLDRERRELETDDAGERRELMGIYIGRGLTPELARQVSDQLMAHDALGAHARDELGITDHTSAQPLQAAAASAASFAIGALLPVAVVVQSPVSQVLVAVPVAALLFLALLGSLAARAGGAHMLVAAARVTFWGAVAMAVTAGVGALFGTVTG
jgi:VIT1/CCC1 family predicted Fe2+/Mn2+ transporter